mgnify:CR=1 FL=1
MIKKTTLFTILALTSLTLVACQQKQEATTSASTEQTSSTSSEASSSSSEVKKMDYSLYNEVIEKYSQLQNKPSKDINLKANLKDNYPQVYSDIEYCLYDFDKNGTDELIIALKIKSGKHDILDIRTIQNDKVIQLTNAENHLDFIGEKVIFVPLEDGYFQLSSASGGKQSHKLYKLNTNTPDLELLTESDTEDGLGTRPPLLNQDTFSWKSVTKPISGETTPSQEIKGMNISSIQNGDFSSISGTWRNSAGVELVFDKHGLVSDNSQVSIEHAKEIDHYLKTSLLPKNGGAGGSAIAFLPAGVSLTMSVTSSSDNSYTDTSDTTKDRLWSGQQLINGHTDGFFYKVE